MSKIHHMTALPTIDSRVMLLMKDGTRLDCAVKRVITMQGEDGIAIYHKRKVVDLRKAEGWWPNSAMRNAEEPR